jgi:hypothetical protein
MRKLAPLALLVLLGGCKGTKDSAPPGQAGGAVSVMPASYGATSNAPEDVISECKFERDVAEAVAKSSPTAVVSGTAGKVLNLEIIRMKGVETDWTGERSVAIEGTLLDGGTTVGTFKMRRGAMGGVFGGMRDVCRSLDTVAKEMGEDIADWLTDPKMDSDLGG